jgi:hypothetical protein
LIAHLAVAHVRATFLSIQSHDNQRHHTHIGFASSNTQFTAVRYG